MQWCTECYIGFTSVTTTPSYFQHNVWAPAKHVSEENEVERHLKYSLCREKRACYQQHPYFLPITLTTLFTVVFIIIVIVVVIIIIIIIWYSSQTQFGTETRNIDWSIGTNQITAYPSGMMLESCSVYFVVLEAFSLNNLDVIGNIFVE